MFVFEGLGDEMRGLMFGILGWWLAFREARRGEGRGRWVKCIWEPRRKFLRWVGDDFFSRVEGNGGMAEDRFRIIGRFFCLGVGYWERQFGPSNQEEVANVSTCDCNLGCEGDILQRVHRGAIIRIAVYETNHYE